MSVIHRSPCEPHDECFTGNHVFVVTKWIIQNTPNISTQSASTVMCQHCLMTLQGRDEIEAACNELSEKLKNKTRTTNETNSRNKKNKSAPGEEQKAD